MKPGFLAEHPLGDVQMRKLKLTKAVAIIEPAGQEGAVGSLRNCADSEFVSPYEPHQGSESDD